MHKTNEKSYVKKHKLTSSKSEGYGFVWKCTSACEEFIQSERLFKCKYYADKLNLRLNRISWTCG